MGDAFSCPLTMQVNRFVSHGSLVLSQNFSTIPITMAPFQQVSMSEDECLPFHILIDKESEQEERTIIVGEGYYP